MKDRERVSVEHAISGMSDSHLHCRDFGHSWRPYSVEREPQRRCFREALLCSRCKTIRLRLINDRGEQLATSYKYADDYLIEGLGRLTGSDRDAVRLSSLHSMMSQLDAAEARKGARRGA